jgi:hypothetical protein
MIPVERKPTVTPEPEARENALAGDARASGVPVWAAKAHQALQRSNAKWIALGLGACTLCFFAGQSWDRPASAAEKKVVQPKPATTTPVPSGPVMKADVVPTSLPANVNQEVAQQVYVMKQKIADRAAVDLPDDFRSGFQNWDGVDDWGRSWQHDIVLGVRPSKLALFKPSLAMQDYHFEFIGQIEKKALSFVFRARDLANYYVMKIERSGTGPIPVTKVIHYAVVDGKPEKPVSVPLPFLVTKDTVYRIDMSVKGDGFALFVNGKVADVWSDGRFKTGGVGFFCGKDEEARILSLRVSHQNDALGRAAAIVSKQQ